MSEEFKLNDEFVRQMTEDLIKPGTPYTLGTEKIRGIAHKVFENSPRNLVELYSSSLEEKGFIPELLTDWYGDYDRTFIVYQGERYSFSRVFEDAASLSWRLREQYRISKGDRIIIAMRNYPEYCISFMAITAIGAIAVPLNAWWKGPELDYGIRDSRPKLMFADQERADRLRPFLADYGLPLIIARPFEDLLEGARAFDEVLGESDKTEFPPIELDADDDAHIIYTSGSTGNPKGVVGTHRAIISAIMGWGFAGLGLAYLHPDLAKSIKPEHKSSVLLTVPLFHVTGLIAIFLASFQTKRKMVMMYKWDPEEALRLIEAEKITMFNGVPTMSWELINSPDFDKYDTSSLGALSGGGASRPPEHVLQLEKQMDRHIAQIGYGLTETTALGSTNSGDDYYAKPGSVGRPTSPIVEAKIIDASGNTLGGGETGEICFKTSSNFRCYWGDSEATADAFIDDGWFRTGDIGLIDEDGYIFIKDRAKDLVIRGGENISCKEVEDAIYEHPAVFETVVFGVPDERLGEQLAAVVMVARGATVHEEELRRHTGDRLAKFKVPEYVWIQTEPLPRIASGKIFKRGIKDEKIEALQQLTESK